MKDQKFRKTVESIIWTIFIVFLLRAFVIQGYVVPSGSMENTLLPGDFLLALKFTYGLEIPYTGIKFFQFKKPRHREIVIFLYPVTKKQDYVKRCIGLPGDTIQIINKVLYINGVRQEEKYVVHKDPTVIPPLVELTNEILRRDYQRAWESGKFMQEPRVRDNFGPVVVPEGYFFAMGDNRDYSFDSRFFGPVPLKYLKGTPLIIYFSIDLQAPLWKKIRFNRFFKIIPLL
ncbi:MAG: signal peptidase I [candidate division WOR-3 bacterium]